MPQDLVHRPRISRTTVVLLIVIAAIIVVLIAADALSGFYVNFLWFHYSGVGSIWTRLITTKIVLGAVFSVVAIALIWGCLYLVDKVVARTLFTSSDSELVRRYQATVGPHVVLLRTGVAVVIGLVVGSSAPSQWQHWILFEHTVAFGVKDPLFHRDVSFFVDRLPFLSYLVDWIFVALVVAFIVSVIAYFLNGAIRLQGVPRFEPRAIAHLSLLLGLMALERAWAYYFVDRYTLDLSHDAYVAGAGWTDVHVRLPAMTLLAIVSLAAFVILIVNVYQRTWTLPAIAVGLWAFLALAVGVIYPALVQALRVTPAQSHLELPYIKDNIAATRLSMGIENVTEQGDPANQDLTASVVNQYAPTIDATQQWDPIFSGPTFTKLQQDGSYYSLSNLTIDRYKINGTLEPVDIAVRTLSTSGIPTQSWINTHLQFTHGYGAVVAEANEVTSGGNPLFSLSSVPETTNVAALRINQPDVYFAPGQDTYVVVDTKQLEVDGSSSNGVHYNGSGGVPIGASLLNRLAFSVHLHDFNLLISSLITNKSRLIYIPDIRTLVQKALPFLTVDSNPYAVIDKGQIDWVVDAYTTTSYYPYAEPANSSVLSSTSGLSGDYNYVRDAVKVVVNAYSGKMSFYAIDPKADPLMQSYEAAFPGMFKPISQMDPVLLQHLRYPQDLLMVQAAMYGRYHITSPSAFYNLHGLWSLSETTTTTDGSPSSALPYNPNTGLAARYQPIYELLQLPGDSSLNFWAIEPLEPYSKDDSLKTLSDLLVANSSYGAYGELKSFVTPPGKIHGPGLANADIRSNQKVSQEITLLDQKGSTATLGTVQVLPIADSLLYIRPLYVSSSQTAYPLFVDDIVVYGSQVAMEPTLQGALAQVFGGSVSANNSGPTSPNVGSVPSVVSNLIAEAAKAYSQAQSALSAGNLGNYQSDVAKAGADVDQAEQDLSTAGATKNSKTSSAPTATTSSAKAADVVRA